MKILLIDDDAQQAKPMARVLQRMGHAVTIALHATDALMLVRGRVDVVLTDIDMPGMNGLALAREIHLRVPNMPIAFVSTGLVKPSVVDAASRIGPVLPGRWTVTDLKELMVSLGDERRTLFETTASAPAPDAWDEFDELAKSAIPELIEEAIGSAPIVTRTTRKVRLSFRRWSQVESLCDRWSDGPVRLSMGIRGVAPDQLVSVVLVLPDRTTMVIEGKVVNASEDSAVVGLVVLTPERVACLHTSCHQLAAGTPLPERGHEESWEHRMNKACVELKVSDIISGNIELRSQIEQLASKLRPKSS